MTSRALALAAATVAIASPLAAQEQVTFALNWLPVAEHGGFYQAVADGTYAACGLTVEIIPGGPQVNNKALLLAGRVDFHMGGDMLQAFNAVLEDIPVVAVAAMFQKNPQILMTHPGKAATLEDVRDLTILVDDNAYTSYYQWLIQRYGFRAENREPYTYNAAPFLADEGRAMQGYLTSEPYLIEQEGGFVPEVFLLADYGFDSYATTIETMRTTVEQRPEVVKCFVEGSIKGWYNYLWGDNSAANAEITRINPDFGEDKIDFAISQMKTYDILTAGDAETMGIGAITEEKLGGFFDAMVSAGVVPPDLDWRASFDSRFINQGLGIELKK